MERSKDSNPRVQFLINIAYWLVIIAIIFLVLRYLVNMIMPIFLAFIFAAIARPISKALSRGTRSIKGPDGQIRQVKRKLHLNQNVAGIISVLVLFLVIVGLLTLLIVRLVNGATDVVSAIPTLYQNNVLPGIEQAYNDVLQFSTRFDPSVQEAVADSLPNVITALGSTVTSVSAKLLSWLSSLATSLPSVLLKTVICMIATVFIAIDFERIQRFFRRNMPERIYGFSLKVKESFLEMIWQFVKSYFIIFCITVAEITVGLLIIGVPDPLLFAVLIGIFDAFPIVGSGMILLPWSVITLFTGNVARGIGLMVLYATVVIARQVIEPKIVGKHVGLRPIVTLTCMYAGSKLFGGIVGLFGLPITAAILVDLNDNGIINIFKRNDPETDKPQIAPAEGENI